MKHLHLNLFLSLQHTNVVKLFVDYLYSIADNCRHVDVSIADIGLDRHISIYSASSLTVAVNGYMG